MKIRLGDSPIQRIAFYAFAETSRNRTHLISSHLNYDSSAIDGGHEGELCARTWGDGYLIVNGSP